MDMSSFIENEEKAKAFALKINEVSEDTDSVVIVVGLSKYLATYFAALKPKNNEKFEEILQIFTFSAIAEYEVAHRIKEDVLPDTGTAECDPSRVN